VGDCTLEPVPGGWVCKDANGNIFKVSK